MEQINKPRGTYADYKSGNYSDRVFVFELVNKNAPTASMRSKETGRVQEFPLTKPFPMIGSILQKDEKTGRVIPKRIRYVNGEDSIFVEKQTPDDKDFPKPKILANFIKGRFHVDGSDSPRLDFFMNWDINETKEGRDPKKDIEFRLVDTAKMASKAREADKVKFDAINWCYTADFKTKIEPFASLIFTDEQMMQNADEIRWNLKIMAERNPSAFKALLDDPKTERKMIVKSAIHKGILEVNANMNAIVWSENPSSPITVAAQGKDAIEDFVAKSFSTDGEKYYKSIEEMVNEYNKPAVKETFKAQVEASDETDEYLVELIEKGVAKGLVTINDKRTYWKYKERSFMKQSGMVKALRDNNDFVQDLKAEILLTV